jgi:hypothetical protein
VTTGAVRLVVVEIDFEGGGRRVEYRSRTVDLQSRPQPRRDLAPNQIVLRDNASGACFLKSCFLFCSVLFFVVDVDMGE